MTRPSRRTHWRWFALCLATIGTSACSTLLRLARFEAEEAAGETERAPTPTIPAAVSQRPLDASAPDLPAGTAANAGEPGSTSGVVSTYESAPMMGLSARTFARPYSLMGSLSPRPGTTPECRTGPQTMMDVLYAPAGTPVDASGPLGTRVAQADVPVYRLFALDGQLRSAHAFQSGAALANEGAVCGRSFAYYYLELSLGWSHTPAVAVSR